MTERMEISRTHKQNIITGREKRTLLQVPGSLVYTVGRTQDIASVLLIVNSIFTAWTTVLSHDCRNNETRLVLVIVCIVHSEKWLCFRLTDDG